MVKTQWLTVVSSQGHLVHNWKARWFVLTPDKLLYYKYDGGRRDSSQRGKILLNGCQITCPFLQYENRPVSVTPWTPPHSLAQVYFISGL